MEPTQSYPLNYPVFEADQVLTKDDLNKLFDYLDSQQRLTRTRLIGMGIACGLELRYDVANITISISKGCGITSWGYLVLQEDITLKYYRGYTIPDSVPTEDQYIPFTRGTGKAVLYELLSAGEYSNINDKTAITALSAAPADFLQDKVVVLYLEMNEDNLKNCLTGDCDNKGIDMAMSLKRLLISRNDLLNVSGVNKIGAVTSADDLPDLFLQRINVPATALNDFNAIYTAYTSIFDTGISGNIIDQLSAALDKEYQFISPLLTDFTVSPFAQAKSILQKRLSDLQKNVPYGIQYYYDFIDDLIKAYNELKDKIRLLIFECCPDDNKFPLHLLLGLATVNTAGQQAAFRQYFIYSPLFSLQQDVIEEIRLLFRKIKVMMDNFFLPSPVFLATNTNLRLILGTTGGSLPVKITPSTGGAAPLSRRAIPYYYQVDNNNPIYGSWNYAKTRAGKANQNLSYNADKYNSLPEGQPFISPLLYSTEPYNFFRIEGHIGQNYYNVLKAITQQQNTYRLPFDVVAVKIGNDASNIQPDITCSFSDLEAQYDLLKAELYCKLGDQICFYASQPYVSNIRIFTGGGLGLLAGLSQVSFTETKAAAMEAKPAAFTEAKAAALAADQPAAPPQPATTGQPVTPVPPAAAGQPTTTAQPVIPAEAASAAPLSAGTSLADFNTASLQLSNTGMLHADVLKYTTLLPIYLRPVFQANVYAKGQFLSGRPCFAVIQKPPANTTNVGLVYLMRIKQGAIPAYPPNDINLLPDYMLKLTDLIEDIISTIFYAQLAYFNADDFSAKYQALTDYAASLAALLQKNPNAANIPQGLAGQLSTISGCCNKDKLQTLKQEYQLRMQQLQQSLLLNNFITKHPGIDHKAGVPAGGTFVLVYYEKPPLPSMATGTAASASSQLVSAIHNPAALQSAIAGMKTAAPAATMAKATALRDTRSTASGGLYQNLASIVQDKQYAFTVDQQQAILKVITQKLPSGTLNANTGIQLPDKGVIADFYLPYLCCSGCGCGTTFVFPQEPPATGVPAFDIRPVRFAFNDPGAYPFTVFPPVAQADIVTASPGPNQLLNPDSLPLTVAGNALSLKPAMPNLQATLISTLRYQGIALTLTIVRPVARYTITVKSTARIANNMLAAAPATVTIQFTALDAVADIYDWSINGKSLTDLVPGTVSNASPLVDAVLLLRALDGARQLVIMLTISYTINGVTATDAKKAEVQLEQLSANINKGPFEPRYA